MFICTEVCNGVYKVLDTYDMVVDTCSESVVLNSFSLGFNILGLKRTAEGIEVEDRYMNTRSKQVWNGVVPTYVLVKFMRYWESNGFIILEWNSKAPSGDECLQDLYDNYRDLCFIKDGKIVAVGNHIPKTAVGHVKSPVFMEIESVSKYNGRPVISLVLNYYEVAGEDRIKYVLIYGMNGVVEEVDWFNPFEKEYKERHLPKKIQSGKFKWCDYVINLAIQS